MLTVYDATHLTEQKAILISVPMRKWALWVNCY